MQDDVGTDGLREARRFAPWLAVVTLFALTLLPLVLSPAPISVDLNNHLVRYVALADHFSEQQYSKYYLFTPAVFPNLGMDVVGSAIIYLLGVDIGSRIASGLVLIAVPSGFLILSRCIHGRLRQTDFAVFVILAYSHIFVWGFSNFLLGAGLGLSLLGFWIVHEGRPTVQLAGAIVGGAVLMFVHALSFGIWGILVAAFELGRWLRQYPRSGRQLLIAAARLAAVAVAPMGYFLLSKTAGAPQGALFFAENLKQYDEPYKLFRRVIAEVFSRVELLIAVPDSGIYLLNLVVGIGLLSTIAMGILCNRIRFDGRFVLPLSALVALWAFMPPNIYGSGYANDRIPLLLWSVVFASIRWSRKGQRASFAIIVTLTLSFTHYIFVVFAYSFASASYDAYVRELRNGQTTNIAVTILNGGAERNGLQPYCSAFEFLAFAQRSYAVQTFEYASQQPIATRGVLRQTVRRRSEGYTRSTELARAGKGSSWSVASVVIDHFAYGYEAVTVCGTSTRGYAAGYLQPNSEGLLWSLYLARPLMPVARQRMTGVE